MLYQPEGKGGDSRQYGGQQRWALAAWADSGKLKKRKAKIAPNEQRLNFDINPRCLWKFALFALP